MHAQAPESVLSVLPHLGRSVQAVSRAEPLLAPHLPGRSLYSCLSLPKGPKGTSALLTDLRGCLAIR